MQDGVDSEMDREAVKHIVGFSGGIDSQTVAGLVLDRYGPDDVILLNSNAGQNEDPITDEFVQWYSNNIHHIIRVHLDRIAKIREQHLKAVLLRRLSGVIKRPVLFVGCPLRDRERFGDGCRAVRVPLAFNDKLDSEDVFAEIPTKFEVGAIAIGTVAKNTDGIFAGWLGLRRNDPFTATFGNSETVGNVYCFDFSGAEIHGIFSLLRCKGRGPIVLVDCLTRCHKHLAGYGFVGCHKHSAGPVMGLTETAGFEPAPGVILDGEVPGNASKASAFGRSATSPLSSLFSLLMVDAKTELRRVNNRAVRLRKAIEIIKRKIADGEPWPG